MSLIEPQPNSRRELRKALIRLRMEMHRQEIRHETSQLLQPLRRVRGMSQDWQGVLGIKHAPLWGMGIVTLLGFLGGKGTKAGGLNSVSRLVRLGTTLMPLIKLVLQGSPPKR
ncbi:MULTISPECIES: hypothetical protein [unclassified Pseudomonas]|uniref:hypothetical protein n=1 Tax=unclassified Pseudomonas TaxID=196821 RepID=UPI002AC9BCEB|nr:MULTISPECIES: hypothetical protein [unclassified Pseudomonas]MEB0041349.1 hypothetical protein [Pseudomonas sp. MH10]MEB0076247.1 hypothetical protein [Pseudomonas sp. MH10out]MEB0090742.1 hypothetical protein [Pseudomonas sp. CCI4.2]MEB0100580.1 hypothetical protein [Pseudomonas sp. CCI3.2]MEB0121362.1 hypothetical protein [Pseudomonas sp. CCI1.2]